MTIKSSSRSGTRRQMLATAAQFARATKLAIISVDSVGNIEFANLSASSLFGYADDEMLGRPITIIVPERMRGAHMAGMLRASQGHKPNLGGRPVEVSALKKDGTEFPIEITLSSWRSKQGFHAGAVITDITERREREGRLLRLASQDTLTGLLNRHRFSALLTEALDARQPTSIILLDLDGFKDVNDTHGHVIGDALLQAVGVRLPYMLRPDASIARIGGDEFAVLLRGVTESQEAHAQAELILQAFAKPFEVGGEVLELGTSIGIAHSPAHGADAEELLASADYALYRAKTEARHSIRTYAPEMREASTARRELRDELLNALRRNELELYYQPQVNLAEGSIVGLEALIRWNHPLRGLLAPVFFLPALDQSALALEIGWWTLDQAAKRAGELQSAGHQIRVSVNLFPGQLRAQNLIHKVTNALQRHRLAPDRLELEVTETIALADDDRSLEAMAALRDVGVRIAFDDFGTGYASLSSLQRYPITTLKIDRGLIRGITQKPGDGAIARALIGLSRDMALETIAEGIETVEQEQALIALGCPLGQGYLYGKAMPFEDVLRMITEQSGLCGGALMRQRSNLA